VGEKKVERPGGGALPAEHTATRYAYAQVCRRCGQDWPCTFFRGVPLPERWVDDESPLELLWVRLGIVVTTQSERRAG